MNILKPLRRVVSWMISKSAELLRLSSPGAIYRRNLNQIFLLRERIFFRKKKPGAEGYPFDIVDPFEVFGEENLYGDFSLVGENWQEKNSEKPVAILWGFNNWKWGFVSAYLPQYRTAFAPRKMLSLPSLAAIRRFPIQPAAFIFWGFTEPLSVRLYAKWRDLKVFRMEDGFIRSAELGASHSTPYSLVIDSKGLHYNPAEPSDLECILNEYSFSEAELHSAKACLDLFNALNLSKYNPPSYEGKTSTGIKVRKRVAVFGQVENDMSIRLGNPDRWSMEELIRVAKHENPGAEIVYRPHPDVYRGYQRSRLRRNSVASICTIVSPETPLVDFLDTVDHVYTITSLSGLEALLRGKRVTVVGAAFYAGWGLTDDRIHFPRRTARRSLIELFAAVYLKYPSYLANLADPEVGFRTACLRIASDRETGAFDLFSKLRPDVAEDAQILARSEYWPRLLFQKRSPEHEAAVQRVFDQINFGAVLSKNSGRLLQTFYAYAVLGACSSNRQRERFLNDTRNLFDSDIYNSILLDLANRFPGAYIAAQIAWMLSEADERIASVEVLEVELAKSLADSARVVQSSQGSQDTPSGHRECEGDLQTSKTERIPLSIEQAALLYETFEKQIDLKNFDVAINIGKVLLLENQFVFKLAQQFAKLADLRFDYKSAQSIAQFSQRIDIYGHNRMMTVMEARSFTESDVVEHPLMFSTSLAKVVALKPDRINDAIFLAEKFADHVNAKQLEKIFRSSLRLDNEQSVRKALGFIAIEDPGKAIRILERLIEGGENSETLRIAYSQALSFAGRVEDALAIMREALHRQPTSANYREMLRLLVLVGRYSESLTLVRDAQRRKLDLGDMHPRKAYFGCRMVAQAFETFKLFHVARSVSTYYSDRYYRSGDTLQETDRFFFLAVFGPGDEIRFASIYPDLRAKFRTYEITISCDPRLKPLFDRSFQYLSFIGVRRPRSTDPICLSDYSQVPGSDITGVVDNNAHQQILNSERIMLVTDMLSECRPHYEAFPGEAYLKHDERKANRFRAILPRERPLIGLSWRSSLTTHSRNEHYLTVEELEPLLKIEGVQFVNFQYDECSDELEWIEARYPGKMIDFSDVDHYNDFDSVAALMKCMDLMIAPATTVVELSGALGCPTWMISNSSELHWRKTDDRGKDVWHRSIRHIEGSVLGDKGSLVKELTAQLRIFVQSSRKGERLFSDGVIH